MSNLLTTQLYNFHVDQKSKLIEFAGWDMPFSYDGTLKEHNYVRNNCGFFDVSHMGRLVLDIDQIQNVSKLICSDILNLDNSKALFSKLCSFSLSALLPKLFVKNIPLPASTESL